MDVYKSCLRFKKKLPIKFKFDPQKNFIDFIGIRQNFMCSLTHFFLHIPHPLFRPLDKSLHKEMYIKPLMFKLVL